MRPFGVIETVDIFEDRLVEFVVIMVGAAVGLFFLEVLEEALAAGIVKRITFLREDCTIFSSSSTFLKAYDVYCVPRSEWNIRPFGHPRRE